MVADFGSVAIVSVFHVRAGIHSRKQHCKGNQREEYSFHTSLHLEKINPLKLRKTVVGVQVHSHA
jgi:hypothetical protein